MSFLTDLLEGNTSNLGTDIVDAPSSLASHPDQLAETAGGAALVAAPFLLPGVLGGDALAAGGLGATDALAGGGAAGVTDIAAGTEAGLGATDLAAGGTDLAATTDLAAGGAAGAGDLASAAPGMSDVVAQAAAPAGGVSSPSAVLGGGDVLGAFGTGGADALGSGSTDALGLGGAFQQAGAIDAPVAASPAAPTQAAAGVADVPQAAQPGFVQQPPSAVSAPAASPGSDMPGAPAGGGAAPAQSGSGISNLLGPNWGWKAAGLGLGAGGLAYSLMNRPGALPAQSQQAQQIAQQNAAAAAPFVQSVQTNTPLPAQAAQLQQTRDKLTAQAKQVLFNMGVQNPEQSTQWVGMQQQIEQQMQIETQKVIDSNLKTAMGLTGQSAQMLYNLGAQQIQQDTAFQNQIANATGALGKIAMMGASGGGSSKAA